MTSGRAYCGTLCSALLSAAVLLTGCGDPKTNDKRGYTKAPLEHAGWVVKGEEAGAMRKLGHPNQTTAQVIEVAAPGHRVVPGPGVDIDGRPESGPGDGDGVRRGPGRPPKVESGATESAPRAARGRPRKRRRNPWAHMSAEQRQDRIRKMLAGRGLKPKAEKSE